MAGGSLPKPRRAIGHRPVIAAVAAAVLGLGAAVAFGFYSAEPLVFAGSSLMVAGASAMSGALLGFLFGVPRLGRTNSQESPPYVANTNLEQVSDWLTKILIGIGLTQLGALSAAAGRLVDFVGPTFADKPAGTIFAAAMIIYFAILGFLGGWLITRIYLGPALSHADREALNHFVEAQAAEDEGDSERAATLRRVALEVSQGASRRYAELRLQPPDQNRIAAMEAIVEAARTVALAAKWTKEEVRAVFRKGTDFDRILALALMEADHRLADLDTVIEGITFSRSAFEQFHALKAAGGLVSGLSPADAIELRTAIEAQMGSKGRIRTGNRRWQVARQLLTDVGDAERPA